MKKPYWLLLFLLLLNTTVALYAQDVNRAALVIQTAAGETVSQCVSFDEPQISGLELLTRSGLAVETSVGGLGAAVCRIAGTGCPADDCFCHCRGPECVYWSYWRREEGQWRYAQLGASASQVSPGAVEGWSWGPGSVTEAIAPPLLSFAAVCGADAAANTPDKAISDNSLAAEGASAGSVADEGPEATSYWPYLAMGLIILGLGATLSRVVARKAISDI